MTDLERLQHEIRVAGNWDYIDLQSVAQLARRIIPNASQAERRLLALRVLEGLLNAGLIEAGELYPPGEFSPWPFSTEEAMARIEKEWQERDQRLHVGEVAWFYVREPLPP